MVSIKLMQVCLVLGITDDGNLNLQPVSHIRERVISKCRACWPRAWEGWPPARLIGAPPSHSAADCGILRGGRCQGLFAILNLGVLPPPQGAWEVFLFVTNDWIGVPPAMWWAKDTSVVPIAEFTQ